MLGGLVEERNLFSSNLEVVPAKNPFSIFFFFFDVQVQHSHVRQLAEDLERINPSEVGKMFPEFESAKIKSTKTDFTALFSWAGSISSWLIEVLKDCMKHGCFADLSTAI